MIRNLKLVKSWRGLNPGFAIEFKPGMNVLVGDQGCGKSSVLDLLRSRRHEVCLIEESAGTKVLAYDFEKDNTRTATAFAEDINLGIQVQTLFVSHGQASVLTLADIFKRTKGPSTVLLDEPDMGLSIRSCRAVSGYLSAATQAGHQVIASIHSPIIILDQTEVYSLEHKQWMNSSDFVRSQMT